MTSACGDQRTSVSSRSHSRTASGVLPMCDEHPVRAAQRILVLLLVVDVCVYGVDADDVALVVAVRA